MHRGIKKSEQRDRWNTIEIPNVEPTKNWYHTVMIEMKKTDLIVFFSQNKKNRIHEIDEFGQPVEITRPNELFSFQGMKFRVRETRQFEIE